MKRFLAFFSNLLHKGLMSWKEDWQLAQKDWAGELTFDRRGALLGYLLLVSVFWTIFIFIKINFSKEILDTYYQLFLSFVHLQALKNIWTFFRTLRYFIGKKITFLFVVLFGFLILFEFALLFGSIGAAALVFAFAGCLAVTFAVAGVGTGSFARAITNASADLFADLAVLAKSFAETIARAVALARPFIGTGVVASVVAGIIIDPGDYLSADIFIILALFLILLLSAGLLEPYRRARLALARAIKNEQLYVAVNQPLRELAPPRKELIESLGALILQKSHFNLGLSGRRGLGKSNLLHQICESFYQSSTELYEVDTKDWEKRRAIRLTPISILLPTPTEFSEKGFLMALLEHIAQRINVLLAGRIPAVAPYPVEKELQEKRRLLDSAHWRMLLILATIWMSSGAIYYFGTPRQDPIREWVAPAFATGLGNQQASVSSGFGLAMRDSLAGRLQERVDKAGSTLTAIKRLLADSLLKETRKDSLSLPFWAAWDSLKQQGAWQNPSDMDTFFLRAQHYRHTLDSLMAMENVLQQWQDSLKSIRLFWGMSDPDRPVYTGIKDLDELIFWVDASIYYVVMLLLFFAPFAIFYITQEGPDRLSRDTYDPLRNEIALYERTNELLDRLKYQMSFGEGHESGFEFKASGLSKFFKAITFGAYSKQQHSKHREMRPFTILSLVEEYRTYMKEVLFYLEQAQKYDLREGETPEPIKIVIAIDELDKVLNPQRLYEMLKSIKAIFEIPNVYYILSISEDALETYNLRHLETKNEIDSAFTHIFNIPPMDAASSLTFFAETSKKLEKNLYPAAIVLGGGVPRDMHRLLDLLTISSHKESLGDCLTRLWKEDRRAAIDVIKQNPKLADEWKERWVAVLEALDCRAADHVENVLKQVAQTTFQAFLAENPCPEEEARQTFHRLRSLIRSMAIKSYIYHKTGELETPAKVKGWSKSSEAYYKSLLRKKDLSEWLAKLEILRDAIFELSNNPLGVWGRLKDFKNG